MSMIKLTRQQVRFGEPLPWSVLDGEGKLLLAQGRVVEDWAQMMTLLDRGAFVDQQAFKAASTTTAAGASRRSEPSAPRATPTDVFTLWDRLLRQLDRVLRSATSEPELQARIDDLAEQLVQLVDRDPDIAIYLMIRQDRRRLVLYGVTHALHCASLCVLVARRLEWDEARLMRLLKAALTMNVAVFELQGRLATQGVPMTPAQRELMAAHPQKGAAILRGAGIADEEWLLAVEQHHERPDGTGYPTGTTQASELASVLRLVDVFMAKITPRESRESLTAQEAERQLFQETRGAPIASAVIKEFGIYPPGDLVKLRSGEFAVVVRRGADARAPLVASVTDRKGMPVATSMARDTSKPEFQILGTSNETALMARVVPEQLYGIK